MNELIGEGGTSRVFRVSDTRAVKVSKRAACDPFITAEFARLSSPPLCDSLNIIRVFDLTEIDGRPAFTMELVRPVESLPRPMAPEAAAALVGQFCNIDHRVLGAWTDGRLQHIGTDIETGKRLILFDFSAAQPVASASPRVADELYAHLTTRDYRDFLAVRVAMRGLTWLEYHQRMVAKAEAARLAREAKPHVLSKWSAAPVGTTAGSAVRKRYCIRRGICPL